MSGLDAAVNAWVRPAADALSALVFFKVSVAGAELPLVVLWLVAGAFFFTFRFSFINLRGLRHAFELLRRPAESDQPGQVTHFQALSTAVSGTVGIGNIGGVAIAVSLGGPGAAFWMIVAGFLGMATKFVECTLGVIYRRENPDSSVRGGPMYYLERGFGELGWSRLGRGLGLFYAVGIVIGCLGIGNMFQSNQAFVQIVGVTGGAESWLADKGWLVGVTIALAVASVILGGIRSIARVTSRLVPFMAVLYLAAAFVVLAMNAEALPWAYGQMIAGAFSSDGVAGGALGTMIIGFQRAVFSNEAGIGSATIAHSAVRTGEPLTEGYVSLLEPLIDTVVICQVTALVVITTSYFVPGFIHGGLGGIEMTSAAFERNLWWAPVPLAVAAMLFAFSTMISWSYYGLVAWVYLVGDSRAKVQSFNAVFCIFVALGCMIQLE
ncbi:MAG: alanine:cation symporter family protein, partial [bacterium]|nr:alanine:cation symporter family protein [bacterium]